MQNSIQNFRQSSIVFKKPSSLSEKLKSMTSSNYHRVQYFLLKFGTHFLLINVFKRVFGIFFPFRSGVIQKTGFCGCVKTRSFSIFATNSRSKKNLKNPEHPFVDIGK